MGKWNVNGDDKIPIYSSHTTYLKFLEKGNKWVGYGHRGLAQNP